MGLRRRIRGDPTVNFHGEKRSNQTHESKSDPKAAAGTQRGRQGGQVELWRKSARGQSQRIDLCRALGVPEATGTSERDAAMVMLGTASGYRAGNGGRRQRLRYGGFCARVPGIGVTPHVAQNLGRRRQLAVIDPRTTRHAGYAISPEETEAHRRMLLAG